MAPTTSAANQHRVRALAHRLGLRHDPLARALQEVRDLMLHSAELLAALPPITRGRAVVWTVHGGVTTNIVEGLLAWALRLRGADPRVFLCDEMLPACDNRGVTSYRRGVVTPARSRQLCDRCWFMSSSLFRELKLPTLLLSRLLPSGAADRANRLLEPLDRAELLRLRYKGVDLGQIVYASLARFSLRVHPLDDPQTDAMIRAFSKACVLLADAAEALLEELRPSAVLTSHGIYASWGVIAQMCKAKGIPLTVYALGYRRDTLLTAQGGTYFEQMPLEPVSRWDGLALDEGRRTRLDSYLQNRWGSEDAVTLYRNVSASDDALRAIGLDPNKPTVGVFPNVPWDAQVYQRSVAFADVFEWILETVAFFAQRPQWQLVVRTHPMESWHGGGARQTTPGEIAQRFPRLPANIRVVDADSPVSSYALAPYLRAAAVHGSQLGLELACQGIPVIVSGGALYRGKGFTLDASTRERYWEILRQLEQLGRLPTEQVERARKYAYHLYFRLSVPFAYMERSGVSDFEGLRIRQLAELRPGCDPVLDRLIEGILENHQVYADG